MIDLFQSTRPRGARPDVMALIDRVIGFNPRAHAGRDPYRCRSRASQRNGFNPRAHAGRDRT